MKTRYLTVFLTAAGAMFALSACDSGSSTLDPNVEARLRNDLPAVCTAEKIMAVPTRAGSARPCRPVRKGSTPATTGVDAIP